MSRNRMRVVRYENGLYAVEVLKESAWLWSPKVYETMAEAVSEARRWSRSPGNSPAECVVWDSEPPSAPPV